jgi:hypothetical protein
MSYAAYKSIRDTDFWTSGTDQGCKGKNHWCSINRNIIDRNMSWSNATDGDCISISFANRTKFSKLPCKNKLSYICEVIKQSKIWPFTNQSFRLIKMAPTRRHFKMSAWKSGMFPSVRIFAIHMADHKLALTLFAVDMLTFDSAFNASTIPRNLKVSWFNF